MSAAAPNTTEMDRIRARILEDVDEAVADFLPHAEFAAQPSQLGSESRAK